MKDTKKRTGNELIRFDAHGDIYQPEENKCMRAHRDSFEYCGVAITVCSHTFILF